MPAKITPNHARLEALYEVSRVLNSSLDLGEALPIVIDAAIRLTGAERGFLMLFDEHTGELSFRLARDAARESIEESAFEVSRSVVQEVARSGEPVVTLNAQKDPRFIDKASVVNFFLRSIMAVPLRARGRIIGTLYVDSKTRDVEFTQSDLDILGTFADQAATAIVNAQLYEAQKLDAEVRRVLLEIARAGQAAGTAQELAQRLAQALPGWIGCDRCGLFLRDLETPALRPVAFSRDDDRQFFAGVEALDPAQLPLISGDAQRGPRLLSVADLIEALPTDWLTALRPVSDALVVPIESDTDLIGLLVLDNYRAGRPFSALVFALLDVLGRQLATAFQRLQLFETSQRQLQELMVLNAVAVAVTEATSLDALIGRVRQVIKPVLGTEDLSVLLVDDGGGLLRLHPPQGAGMDGRLALALDQGIVGRVATTGQPRRVADVSKDPSYLELLPSTRSELCVPLKIGERVIGVVNAESSALNAFTAGDERLLVTVAGQLATAIEKQRLFETERQQRELAEALGVVGLGLTLETEIDVVLDRLMGHIARVVPYDAAAVLLLEEDGCTRVAGARGYERFGVTLPDEVRRLRLEVARTPNLLRMAETGQPLVVSDILADPDWVRTAASDQLNSWVGAPVMAQGRCVAFLSLEKSEARFYRPEHAQRLAAFAGYAALALQNVWLLKAAEQRAAELDAVRTASLSLTSSLDVREVLSAVLQGAMSLLPGTQDAHIFLYQQGRLVFGASLWADGRVNVPIEPRPNGLTYTVARTGELTVVPDMHTHPLFVDAPREWRGAIIGLPLKIGLRVVGVMNVAYPQPRAIAEAELRILRLLGEQAAAAIENARLFDATRQQVEELTVLHAIAVAGAESASLDMLLERVTHMIGDLLDARQFGVLLLDKTGLVLQPHASYRGRRQINALVGEGVIGRVASTGRSWRVSDVTAEKDYLAVHAGTLSELCVPLKVNDRVIGVIDAESNRREAFTGDDERLLATVAGQLATAIEKARLLESERAAREQAETLREVASLLNTTLDREQLLGLILDQLARLVKYDSASVILLDDDEMRLVAQRGFRTTAQFMEPRQITNLQHIRAVLDDCRALMIADTLTDNRWQHLPGTDYIRCWLGVPLVVKGRPVGILNLDSEQPGFYTAHDAEVALALANQAAAALDRLRLWEQTQQRERELAILLDIARAVSSSLDLNEVLQHVAVAISQTLNVDSCSVSAYDPVARVVTTLSWHAFTESPGEILRGQFRLDDYPLTARVIDQDDVCIIRAADEMADPAEIRLLRQIGYQTLLMLSVRASGRPVGLMELYSADEAREFTDTDLRLARATADQTGVAIENAYLFQAEREQRELAEALRKAAASLSASLDSDAVLDRLLDQIVDVVPYDSANVMLVDRLTERAWVVRHRGYEQFGPESLEAIGTIHFDIARTATLHRIVETGQPLVISDVAAEPDWLQIDSLKHVRSWAGAPVLAHGSVVAFFGLDKAEAGFYQPKHADRLAAFAGQAALALQNARLFEAERRRVAALTTLHDIGLELSTRLDLPSVLNTMVSGAMRLLDTQMGAFYTVQAETEMLELTVDHNLPAGLKDRQLHVGEDVAGRVALTGETLVVGDYQALFGAGETVQPAQIRSVLGVPIQWQGQWLGVMILLDARLHRFGDSDVDVVRLFADRAAVAIENVRLYAALEKEKQRLELLVNLSQSLASTLNPQEVALRAMDLMRAAIGADKAVMYLSESDDGSVRLMQISGYLDPRLAEADVRVPFGHGVVGYAAQHRRPLAVPDIRQDLRWVHSPNLDEGVLSAIIVPLLAGDELIGVLSLLSDRVRFYQDEHIPLLSAAAVPVALALQNASLFEAEASRVHYLTVLNEITRAAVTMDEMPALLQTMANCLGELTGAESCYITLWDAARQHPIPAAAYGPERDSYTTEPIYRPGMTTLTESVLRAGHTLVVEDIHQSPYVSPEMVAASRQQSALGLPLLAGDQKLGAAIIAFPAGHRFSHEEIQRAEQAAGQIALAMARTRLFDETRRHADELAIASDLLRQLSTLPSVLRQFPALATGLKRLTHCQYATMALLTDDRQAFVITGLDETMIELGAEMRLPATGEVIAPDVLAGRPEFIPAVSASAAALDRVLAGSGITARVTLPLRAGEQAIGALALFWAETDGYARTNFALLNQIADALALAVEKDRLLDETLRRAAELEALAEVSAALRAVGTAHDILAILVDRSLVLFRADAGAILMPTAVASELVYEIHRGLPEFVADVRLPMEASIAGHVFRTGQPYRAVNLTSDPLAHPAAVQTLTQVDHRPRAALYAPLRFGEEVIGVLLVNAVAPRLFSEADLRLLNTIAEVGGNALQRARVLETLEQRVAERTRELAKANEQLKELDRLKDQFVSNVSHELRTPLTAIKLHLGLLEKRGAEVLPRYLPVLQRETERLRRLIEDLLDLSRLRARSTPLNRELHRLDGLVSEVLALHSTRAEEREVALRHELNDSIPLLPVDHAQMIQVFTNLITNAVAYTIRGGRVTVTSHLETSGVLEGVATHIHNDGPSIPAEDLPHLFTRFYRGKTARDTGEPGTGLGLAICKEIVERHGGFIDVASDDQRGTTFTVWLPLKDASSTTA